MIRTVRVDAGWTNELKGQGLSLPAVLLDGRSTWVRTHAMHARAARDSDGSRGSGSVAVEGIAGEVAETELLLWMPIALTSHQRPGGA